VLQAVYNLSLLIESVAAELFEWPKNEEGVQIFERLAAKVKVKGPQEDIGHSL